jgi:hypothetical protein
MNKFSIYLYIRLYTESFDYSPFFLFFVLNYWGL